MGGAYSPSDKVQIDYFIQKQLFTARYSIISNVCSHAVTFLGVNMSQRAYSALQVGCPLLSSYSRVYTSE